MFYYEFPLYFTHLSSFQSCFGIMWVPFIYSTPIFSLYLEHFLLLFSFKLKKKKKKKKEISQILPIIESVK